MEYLWEFNNLATGKQEINWAVANSEWKIMQWHYRSGNMCETYTQWKDALVLRFFRKSIEMRKFLAKKQTDNQRLSEFIEETKTYGTHLVLSAETRMAFIKANIFSFIY